MRSVTVTIRIGIYTRVEIFDVFIIIRLPALLLNLFTDLPLNSTRSKSVTRLAPSAVNLYIYEWHIICIRNKHALRAHSFAEEKQKSMRYSVPVGKEGSTSISILIKIEKSMTQYSNIQKFDAKTQKCFACSAASGMSIRTNVR